MGSRGLAPLQGVLKGGGAAPFFLTLKCDCPNMTRLTTGGVVNLTHPKLAKALKNLFTKNLTIIATLTIISISTLIKEI